ncbi:ABA4-like family protein [Robiginitalea sp.]|uniref:ABA4-like family protein n=1 Tax=Robiginitalea sp. TaxID=1902411 RepID=UPI003C78BD3B
MRGTMEFDLETLFSIANTWILPGWLLLLFAPSWKYTGKIVFYLIILVLAITYAVLLFGDLGSFDLEAGSSLAGLAQAFSSPKAILIGWIHYLAFDLFAAMVIALDARRIGVNRLLMVVPLFFTLMTGPFGLLLYALIRYGYTRKLAVPFPEVISIPPLSGKSE